MAIRFIGLFEAQVPSLCCGCVNTGGFPCPSQGDFRERDRKRRAGADARRRGRVGIDTEETAGPFFQPNSPLKNNFREPGVNGASIDVTGFVLDRRGKSVPGPPGFLAC